MGENNTRYGRRGIAPVLTERFDTVTAYEVTTISGQLNDVSGLRFTLLADPDNTNTLLIGGEGSITFPMEAGFGMVVEIENLNEIYAVIQSGDKLHVLVLDETSADPV